jgi:hypothetical protein
MLNRGLGLEKAENMVIGFKHTKYTCVGMSGGMEGVPHPFLDTICRVVLCCTGVVSPCVGGARGK